MVTGGGTPLKGGSALSIPSPPAIWNKRTRAFITPGISDAERMQGFPANWTAVGTLKKERKRSRWKLERFPPDVNRFVPKGIP